MQGLCLCLSWFEELSVGVAATFRALTGEFHQLVIREVYVRLDQSVTFEELDLPLVFFRLFSRVERAEILAFSRLGIDLARVQSILAGFQFSDHLIPPHGSDGE